jgi:hypothetical protein
MTTLAAALFDAARKCTSVLEGSATGGSTTTLADTSLLARDHWYQYGTIGFLSGNNAGKTAVVSEFLDGTFTFPTQAGACAAGNQYWATSAEFPKWKLVGAINEAMQELTPPAQNTALVVVAHQERYTLPSGVDNLIRVEVAENSAAPYDYVKSDNWYEADGYLYFDTDHEPDVADRIIRLTYIPQWTEIFTDAGVIPDFINRERLAWTAAVIALRWRVNKMGEDEPEKIRQLNEALAMAERMAGAHPVPERVRDTHAAKW